MKKTPVLLSLLSFIPLLGLAGKRPNVIIVMADDMGWSDIGCYGSEIETPNLDRLAKNGLRFTQFYNTGRCCPTRASLLTGTYPHQAGIGWMMSDSGFPATRVTWEATSHDCRSSQTGQVFDLPFGQMARPPRRFTQNSQHNWPRQRGFDRFYGTIHGAGSFFDPNS